MADEPQPGPSGLSRRDLQQGRSVSSRQDSQPGTSSGLTSNEPQPGTSGLSRRDLQQGRSVSSRQDSQPGTSSGLTSNEPQPGTSGTQSLAGVSGSGGGDQSKEGAAAVVWTIDVRELRSKPKKKPELGKGGSKLTPLKRGALAERLAAMKAEKEAEKLEAESKKYDEAQQETQELIEPTSPPLSENEQKIFQKVQELRADKKSLMDPKIEILAAKPKPKDPELTLDRARIHMVTLFQSDGAFFTNEEIKIIEMYSLFESRFEHVTPLHQLKPPDYTFEKTAATIKELLAGPWQDQVQGLRMIRALAMEISYEPEMPENQEKMLALLKEIFANFQGFLIDDRTQLITETCITIAFLCREYRNKMDIHCLKMMITNLLQKTHIVNLAGFVAKAALKYIFHYVHDNSLFHHLIHEFEKTQGQKMIITIAFLMLYVFEFWTLEELKPCLDAFEATFKKIYVFDVKCHIPLRLAFWILNRDLPDRAKKIYNTLEELDQILMDASKFMPPKQASQEELCPLIVRERPTIIAEFESSEENKKEKEPKPQPQLPVDPVAEANKDKSTKKKKRRRKKSTSSSSSSSSCYDSSSDSSSGGEKKRRRKRRKERMRKKLKKLRKLNKLRKQQPQYSSDSSVDMNVVFPNSRRKAKKTNFLKSLKSLPTKVINYLRPKRSQSLDCDKERHKTDKSKGKSSSDPKYSVVAKYWKAKAELTSAGRKLDKLEDEQARTMGELAAMKSSAEEASVTGSEQTNRERALSDPQAYCKATEEKKTITEEPAIEEEKASEEKLKEQ